MRHLEATGKGVFLPWGPALVLPSHPLLRLETPELGWQTHPLLRPGRRLRGGPLSAEQTISDLREEVQCFKVSCGAIGWRAMLFLKSEGKPCRASLDGEAR